jgi:hypothetical protein
MKKLLGRKLSLNKKTVINLNERDMELIKGASVVWDCSQSCSVVWLCCKPTEEYIAEPLQDANQG